VHRKKKKKEEKGGGRLVLRKGQPGFYSLRRGKGGGKKRHQAAEKEKRELRKCRPWGGKVPRCGKHKKKSRIDQEPQATTKVFLQTLRFGKMGKSK